MTNEELVNKALETADLIAAGGDLKDEQSERFITYLRDLSVMAQDARMIPMRSRKRDINKIGIGQRVSVPAAEGKDPAIRRKPEITKTTLDTVEIMTPFEITYDVFEDNIEGDNLEDSIIRLFATQIAMDHEELYIMGDTDSSDTFLALTDGWRKIANQKGHVVDHAAKGVYLKLFGDMLDELPEKFLRDYNDLRYYVSPKVEHGWRKYLAERPTPLGDKVITMVEDATYAGIPVRRVPMIPSNLSATVGGTPYTNLSFAILTLRRNMVVGVHRKMTLERDKDIFGRMRQYAFTSRVDCDYEEPDAVVVAENISLTGSTT